MHEKKHFSHFFVKKHVVKKVLFFCGQEKMRKFVVPTNIIFPILKMVRLTIQERRRIAIDFQVVGLSVFEAMKAARKIVKEMQGVSSHWVENLDMLYKEIIEHEGEGSHLM